MLDRLALALQSFLALLQPPPSKNSAPLIPLAASSHHPHNERTEHLPASPAARDFYSTSRTAFSQIFPDVLPRELSRAAAARALQSSVCRVASPDASTASLLSHMFNAALSPSTGLQLTNQILRFFLNFPQITSRASLLLLQNNVSLITT